MIGEVAVQFAENFRLERGLHHLIHFIERRPEAAKDNIVAVGVRPKWFAVQINVHAAGQRARADQPCAAQDVDLEVLRKPGPDTSVAAWPGAGAAAAPGQGVGQGDGEPGLADATLARGYDDDISALAGRRRQIDDIGC